jgi:GH15 family glucan-1,4-alpha-glucosidase
VEPRIADYAMVGDCQTAALVSHEGSVDWWPSPRFDSSSAFSRLLDPDGGHFSLRPTGSVTSRRRYLDGTMVLETTMETEGAALRLTEALALAQGARGHEIGRESPHAMVRVAEAIGGDLEVAVEFRPRPEYGLVTPRLVKRDGALETVGGPERAVLSGDRLPEPDGARAEDRFTLAKGTSVAYVLTRAVSSAARDDDHQIDPRAALENAVEGWRSWSEMHRGYEGFLAPAVHRSALVIQALTYQPTGAVVAAATTSLPEIVGGDANYDYRFGWLRDASLVARALYVASCSDEACRYFDWMARAAVACRDDDHVQPMFGVEGERDLTEHELDHLRGYRDSRPVRVGNAAWKQRQLDVLGEVVDVLGTVHDDAPELDSFTAAFVCQLVDRAAQDWDKPDASIWEGREGERDYVVSKAMCWVALDRGVALAPGLGEHADPERWSRARDEVAAAILEQGWSEQRGAFAGAFGSDHLDVGVLLLALTGFIAPDDERAQATADVLRAELGTDDGLLRRWTGAQDGGFLAASAWLAEVLARGGRVEEAEELLHRVHACANDVGLLSEMVDLDSGELIGNFPLALSHAGLITAAQAITEARGG